jgi:hypothetical protein
MFFTCRVCEAQNLVPNGDFEQYSGCPIAGNGLDSTLFWFNPTIGMFAGSPDYFNQCSTGAVVGIPNNFCGFQPAHSGNAYAGIVLWVSPSTNFREYIEVPLLSSLVANACYHLEMYINLSNVCKNTTDAIGIYFSNIAISGINNSLPLPFTPQINNQTGFITDTLNWTLVSGNYTATGGENYLLIGNFKDDSNTDTLLVNNNGGPVTYVYIDDVTLSLCTGIDEQSKNQAITIYPNPVFDKLNITVNTKESSEIILYDMASRKLLQQKFMNSVSLNTKQVAKGLYLYEVRNKNGVIKKGKIVKE